MNEEYLNEINEEGAFYEQTERTSDVQLPPVMGVLLLAIWATICLIGFAIIFLGKSPMLGTLIIAVPTFIGMVMKPTFALCIMMLVLPTGAGVGYETAFSLDRGIGMALAISFLLNIIITRPGLHIRNRAIWVVALYTIWISLASLVSPYLGLELRRAFTQFQLLAFILIIYWILETNSHKTFIWALRSYVIGSLGTIAMTFITGTAMRSIEDMPGARYAATLGGAIDANMLACLTSLAFLAAVYLFARDKNILWRALYLAGILFLPTMLVRIGSRGAMVALGFTLLSPLLFVKQVLRRPALVVLLVMAVVLASVSIGLLVRGEGVEKPVLERLTSVGYAKESFDYRLSLIKGAVGAAVRMPTGTGYYAWFERTQTTHWPHNDFFLALGVYGIPGALLFTLFIIATMFVVKRTPIGLEKLFARAILTFLIVMGFSMAQLYHKYFWAFLAFVMASERAAKLCMPKADLEPYVEPEDSLLQYDLA